MPKKKPGHIVDLEALKDSVDVIIAIGNRPGHLIGLAFEYDLVEHYLYRILVSDLTEGQRKYVVRVLTTLIELSGGVKKLHDIFQTFLEEFKEQK